MKRIYFDYAATAPCDSQVLKAMEPYFFEKFGNPSSIHSFGQESRKGLEESRKTVADAIGARPEEIIFTSGGTESDNQAIFGVVEKLEKKGKHIITSAIEHHAVLEPCKLLEKKGFKVTFIKPDKDGIINPQDIKDAITNDTILITIMHANNEIGTIQPISEIGEIAKDKEICFHSDCVQTAGHIPVNVDELMVDIASFAAHKFYGPKGVGALYVRKGTKIASFLIGGDQERGRRASTSNVSGIVGMAKALEIAKENLEKESSYQIALRDKLIDKILGNIPYTILNGHRNKRLPNNVNISFEFIEGESLILNLDLEGIACSTGSACTSSSLEPSHVLLAIDRPAEIAHGSLRITIGRFTKDEEIDFMLEVLPPIVKKLRAMSPLYNK